MILCAAICFGTIPTFAKLTYDHGADPLGLLSLRFALGAAAIWVVLGWRRGLPRPGPGHHHLPLLTVVFAAQSLAFFESLSRIPAVITVLLLYTYPLLVTLAAPGLLGEPLTQGKAVAMIAGFVGVALTLGGFDGSLDPAGVALGLASGVFFAAFLILAKRRVGTDLDPVEMVGWIYAGIGAGYLVILALHGGSFPTDRSGWVAMAGVIVIGTIASMILFASGLRHLPAGVASMLSTLEPACSVALAALALGEGVAAVQLLGILLVLASIAWLGYVVFRSERPEVYVEPL
jgi:drug/metabolite transporter (DMT)-like permease